MTTYMNLLGAVGCAANGYYVVAGICGLAALLSWITRK